jgi:hypothetical protein
MHGRLVFIWQKLPSPIWHWSSRGSMEVGILQEGSARSVANNLWTEATDSTRCRRTTCTLGFQHKQCSSIFLDYFGCVFFRGLSMCDYNSFFFVFLNWRCLSLALDPWMLLYRMFVYLIIDIKSLCQRSRQADEGYISHTCKNFL